MRGVRRHLFALVISTVSVQALVLSVGVARLCGAVEHTHGGQAAPDCPMHHQQDPPESTAHHHHHGDDSAPSSDGPRLSCGCPGDILAMMSTPIGIVAAGMDPPSIGSVAVRSTNPRSLVDVALAPLAPPPRT